MLLFNPQKSHRHPALMDKVSQAITCAVYDTSAILDCKDTNKRAKYKIYFNLFLFSSESIFETIVSEIKNNLELSKHLRRIFMSED